MTTRAKPPDFEVLETTDYEVPSTSSPLFTETLTWADGLVTCSRRALPARATSPWVSLLLTTEGGILEQIGRVRNLCFDLTVDLWLYDEKSTLGCSGVGVVVRNCSYVTLLVVDGEEPVSGWADLLYP